MFVYKIKIKQISSNYCKVLIVVATGDSPRRVGLVTSFMRHSIKIVPYTLAAENTAENLTHNLAKVEWYEDHPHRSYFGPSIIIASSVSHSDTAASFIPVSRISHGLLMSRHC